MKNGKNKGCQKRAKGWHQLVDWLKELKQLREQASCISLNKKLPNIQNYSEGYFVTFKHGSVHISKFTECDGKDLCTSDDIYDEIVAYLLSGHMMM